MEATPTPNATRIATAATALATAAFALSFAAWVLNAVLVSHLTRSGVFAFDELQTTLLLAAPFFTGALCRIPLGLLCDRLGARPMMIGLLLAVAGALAALAQAQGFASYLAASLALGLAGGSFSVGIAYVSLFVERRRQGFALGVFGLGTAGAALTTALAPTLLMALSDPAKPDTWRQLPYLYAAVLVATAAAVWLAGPVAPRRADRQSNSLRAQLAPLADPVVWRFGGYYALVFGATVALTQWLVPYGMNVHGMTLQGAGLLATLIALPSGLVKPVGGWLADRLGPGPLLSASFGTCLAVALLLSVPRMEVVSPGEGIAAKAAGVVERVGPDAVVIGGTRYALQPEMPTQSGAQRWHTPLVHIGDKVATKQLIASGSTRVVYPQPLGLVLPLIALFALACGIGMAGVLRFIPERFPDRVGAVSGLVGMLGAVGGFVLPVLFGALLHGTGLWASCWWALALVAGLCFWGLNTVRRHIVQEQAPDLARLSERSVTASNYHGHRGAETLQLLEKVPLFAGLDAKALAAVLAAGEEQTAEAGSVLFREGDAGDACLVLLEGRVRLHRQRGEQDLELAQVETGGFFGELALFDGSPRSATASVLQDSWLFVLGRDVFLALLAHNQQMLAMVLARMAGNLRGSNDHRVNLLLQQQIVQTEAEVARLRSVSQMVAGVAHEVNTPLGIIVNAASLMGELLPLAKSGADDEAFEDLAGASSLVLKNARHAANLVQTFRSLSVRQITHARERVAMPALVQEVLGLFALEARTLKLDVQFAAQVPQDAPLWDGIPGHLTQVLLNLLTNVGRYAYPDGNGGPVHVTVERPPLGGFVLVVRDEGAGMAAKTLSRIFEPFFTTGRDKDGVGLGLAIVHETVTAGLGGKIAVQSQVAAGTAFTIELPDVVPDALGGHTVS